MNLALSLIQRAGRLHPGPADPEVESSREEHEEDRRDHTDESYGRGRPRSACTFNDDVTHEAILSAAWAHLLQLRQRSVLEVSTVHP